MSKESVIQQAKELVSKKPIILDTETTGLGSDAEIVSIGVVDIGGNILMNQLVKPVNSIPADATRIHGVTNEMVKDSPSFSDIFVDLYKLITNNHVAIYNAEYDIRIIRQTASLAGNTYNPKPISINCVMEMYSRFYGEWSQYHHNYKWHKLINAGKQSGLTIPKNLHNAIADCELTRQVLLYIANYIVE